MQAPAQHERGDIWKLPLKQNVNVEAEVTKLSLGNILGKLLCHERLRCEMKFHSCCSSNALVIENTL